MVGSIPVDTSHVFVVVFQVVPAGQQAASHGVPSQMRPGEQ
jgi:hypothetical protein